MPKRTDISKILIIGSGPIIIGQSAEFDYSGTQACKALKAGRLRGGACQLEPGDHHDRSEIADRTYIEPLTREYLEEIIRIEREMSPSAGFAILPTVGGQTALNLAIELSDSGILEKYNVQAHRREHRGHQESRRPAFLQRRDAEDRPRRAEVGAGEQSERRPRVRRKDRLPGHHSSRRSLSAGRAAASLTTAKN